MQRYVLYFLFLFPILLMAQSPAPVYDFGSLEQKIGSIRQARNLPGAQLAIVGRDGILWQGNFGFADLENQQPVTDETMFRIGSIIKSFTAISVMMMVEKGQLRLEDRVSELAPELPFENPWEEPHPVQMVHLLEHTAGFDDMHLMEYAADGKDLTTLEGLLYHPHSKISRWRPGKYMSYCNSGPAMAAYLVEKKTGQAIEDFVKTNILTPLDMSNSSMLRTEMVARRLSKGYFGPDKEEAPYWHIINRAAGAINSNVTEMAQYVRLFLNRGQVDGRRLLSPASIERIETPTSTLAAKSGVREGYGLCITSQQYKGHALYGHGGGMPGFLANMQYLPELGVGYVLLINQSNGMTLNALNQAVLDCLFPPGIDNFTAGRFEPETSVDIDLSSFLPGRAGIDPAITGYYRTATSRNQLFRFLEWPTNVLQVKAGDGRLYIKPLAGTDIPLENVERHLYRLHYGRGYSSPAVFVRDETGRLNLQLRGALGNYSQTSAMAVWLPIYVFNMSTLLIFSAILAGMVWVPLWFFGRRKIRNVPARLPPLLAAVSIQVFLLLLTIGGGGNAIAQFGHQTPVSTAIYLFSLLAPAFTLLSFWVGIRSFETDMHPVARFHAFLTTMACGTMTAYFWYWGLLGLQLWIF